MDFEYTIKTAHPNAQALMIEDFYWSPIEETGPFGSDDGWDAAQQFFHWRSSNENLSPVNYLKELITRWQYPFFNWHETDPASIEEFIFSQGINDETDVEQKILQLKELLKKTSDSSAQDVSEAELREIVLSSSRSIGGDFLLGQDNAIIGTAFAQLALEGKVDNDFRALTVIALKRQLLPILIDRYDHDYVSKRKAQLTKMLDVMNNVNL